MKRPNMLSATFVKTVKTVKTPGRYGDGRGGLGLSLLVRTAARGHITKCWTQSVRIDRRPTSIGLSRYPAVTLALALPFSVIFYWTKAFPTPCFSAMRCPKVAADSRS